MNPRSRRPLISIVILTHNHADYIEEVLDSIRAQMGDFDMEVIVNDDASVDSTPNILEQARTAWLGRFELILHQRNQFSCGINPCRFVFPLCRGQYMALCEGDDYWTDSYKLQKQIDALRRHQEVDLCVHPAMCLSVRTGKQRKRFDHGSAERIIPLETIVARHNQFAPTASVLMRTSAAQNLPEWFFSEPGLPLGDFFIEAILGRKGALYLPDPMSVYRRDVPGSYTDSFRRNPGEMLDDRLKRMLYFVEKLRGMEGIPEDVLDQRVSYVRFNYALQFLSVGDRGRFIRVSREIRLRGRGGLQTVLATMRHSRVAFAAGRRAIHVIRCLRD